MAPVALLLASLLTFAGQSSPRVVYGADAIPGRYIVVLKDGVNARTASEDFQESLGVQPGTVYSHALNGFSAEMSPEDAQALADDDNVALVTADQYVHTDIHLNPFQTLPTGVDRVDDEQNPIAGITGAPGHPGLDADVAVIDTGVTTQHVDLNVAGGIGLADPNSPGCDSGSYEDDNGHGTHVSGTIAAKDDDHGVTGIAPGARIWAVKVLDAGGGGANSCVVAGIDWVTDRRSEFNDGPGDGDPGIDIIAANMSLGGNSGGSPGSDPMCQAINSAVAAGVMFAVAAGNSSSLVSGFTPAKCPNAVTVSAFGDFDGKPGGLCDGSQSCIPTHLQCGTCFKTTFDSCPAGHQEQHDDTFACFSNFGSGVDIAAPGVDIMSTFPGPADQCDIVSCYAVLSGTSMATPHDTGALVLLHLGGYSGPADGASVMAAMTAAGYAKPQNSSCGFTGDPDVFHEPVLYLGSNCTLATPGPTPSPTPIPSATPTPSPTVAPTPSPTPTLLPTPTRTPIHHPTFTPTPGGKQGDANCDNQITPTDSLAILLATGDVSTASSCLGLADVNCDGDVNAMDALIVLKFVAGNVTSVPSCPDVGATI